MYRLYTKNETLGAHFIKDTKYIPLFDYFLAKYARS